MFSGSFHNPLRLIVNLGFVKENYKNLCAFTKTPIAAVVKSDAYGLGAAPIAQALFEVGCRQFFVVTPQEALAIRAVLPDATLYVLHGFFPGDVKAFLHHKLIPVLTNLEQTSLWKNEASLQGKSLPALLHFDTGMNRLGFDQAHVFTVKEALPFLKVPYIMSHLACADDPKNPYNALQRSRFLKIADQFPGIPRSLAASEGICLGDSYYFDLLRIGISLYGIIPYVPHTRFAIRPQAQILQTRILKSGESIGYGQRYTASGPRRIGTIAMGFSDGLHVSGTNRARVMIENYDAPVIGRISMDLTVVDLTHIPESVAHPGAWVDLFRDNVSHLRLAAESQMALYEITCRIGRRYEKIYTQD